MSTLTTLEMKTRRIVFLQIVPISCAISNRILPKVFFFLRCVVRTISEIPRTLSQKSFKSYMVEKYIKTIHLIYLRGFWVPNLSIYSHFLENRLKKVKFVTFAVSSQKWPKWMEKSSETNFFSKISMFLVSELKFFENCHFHSFCGKFASKLTIFLLSQI